MQKLRDRIKDLMSRSRLHAGADLQEAGADMFAREREEHRQ